MRLLNTTSVQLHEFFDPKIPEYAILSHRWRDGEEVTFKDLTESRNLQAPGWAKIRKSCKVAKSYGPEWIWIDTCCIDKSSNTELSETINSMFQWYRKAKMCIAYLFDVKKGSDDSRLFKTKESEEYSEWFKRGWTLQELLAPRSMSFYDMDWNYLGTKGELAGKLQEVTRIDAEFLGGNNTFRSACIATKMSWMADRETGRKEDIAYSMLGIFNINMALLYGEGELAFVRLQQILLANSADESIFAWKMPYGYLESKTGIWDLEGWDRDEWGLLAPHPKCFKDSEHLTTTGDMIPRPLRGFSTTQDCTYIPVAERTMKNRYSIPIAIPIGLSVVPVIVMGWYNIFRGQARVQAQRERKWMHDYPLNCWQQDELGRMVRIQIYLRPIDQRNRILRRAQCTNFKPHKKMTFTRYTAERPMTFTVLQPQRL